MGQGAFHFLFCVYTQPILCLWLCVTNHPTDFPRYMTKNCWRSVEAHSHDGAGRVLLCVLPIKAANTSFMTICNLLPPRLPKIHDRESLTLGWFSCSWWGRERFTSTFAYKGNQYFIYDCLHPITPQITQDTWPRIVDAHFAMGVSTICNHLIWHSPSFTLIWQPFQHFHLLSSWSLHCSLIIHINISFKICFTVSVNSG